MIRLLIASALCLLFTGCASDEFYKALDSQFKADQAKWEARQAAKEKEKNKPLVDFSWTDEYEVEHRMVVNQPTGSYAPPDREPRLHIPAPWEGPFKFFDRTLSTTERLLPWLVSPRGKSDGGNISYTFGDDAYFQQSRDYSPIDLQRDIVTNPAPETNLEPEGENL